MQSIASKQILLHKIHVMNIQEFNFYHIINLLSVHFYKFTQKCKVIYCNFSKIKLVSKIQCRTKFSTKLYHFTGMFPNFQSLIDIEVSFEPCNAEESCIGGFHYSRNSHYFQSFPHWSMDLHQNINEMNPKPQISLLIQ